MRYLKINEITGFRVNDPKAPVIIRDPRGVLFYSTESLLPRVTEFNLPVGSYFVDAGKITALKEPIKYKLPKMPMPERFIPLDVKRFKIMFARTPDKCVVNWLKGTITFDNSFKEKPIPYLMFILFHEWGHKYFNNEAYCDLYAAREMLKQGFNPSQTYGSQIRSLSHNALPRMVFLSNNLFN